MGVLRPEGQVSHEPVALETAVIATGARPGDSAAKRELFTEETQTVLVFERGAVIRLSAAVADGQLLFLTNTRTGKEVVTQVVRKRSFRPTSCYVDLEFTEASPGFWGIDFPKSAPVLPSQVTSDSSDDEAGEAVKHAVPPDQQEVERLKEEVAELQTQLKSLTGNSASADAGAPPSSVPSDSPTSESARREHEEKILTQLLAQEAQQDQLHGPKRLVAYPKKERSSVVKAASKIATVGAIAAVVVAAVIAAYRFGLLDSFVAKPTAAKPAPSQVSPNLNTVAVPAPKTVNPASVPATPSVAASHTTSDPSNPAAESVVSKTDIETGSNATVADSKRPDAVPTSTAANTMRKEPKRQSGSVTNSLVAASPSSAGSVSSSGAAAVTDSAAAPYEYVAPKLIYSVKPVSPPEALRNYVTGNVNVDALVDVMGHVKSVTVISGPPKLRNQAIAEMKQYVYEPARKNGKPVVSHVQASLKYWYEP
jgi:hypothetical protein